MVKGTREMVHTRAMTLSRYIADQVMMLPFPFYYMPPCSIRSHRLDLLLDFRLLWFSLWPSTLVCVWLSAPSLPRALALIPPLWEMAPNRLMVKGKSLGEPSAEQGAAKLPHRATRAQIQAQEEADFFKDHIPLSIRWKVEGKVEDLWYTMKNMPREDLH